MSNESGESYGFEHHFVDEKVWVTVPTQAVPRELEVVVPTEGCPDLDKMPPTPNTFTPTRCVVNFYVREMQTGAVVHQFSPPVVLRVEFEDEDLERYRAEGYELKLAFWEGSRWVVFTKEKHQFEMHSKSASALIWHWGDPPLAVGR